VEIGALKLRYVYLVEALAACITSVIDRLQPHTLSSDEIVDYVTGEVGQPIVTTAVVICEFGMVDAKLVKDCRVNIVHMYRILDRLPPKVVGGAVGESTLESTACKPHGESMRIVIAAVVRLAAHEGTPDFDNRSAAKL
jgi:hypothetical protein